MDGRISNLAQVCSLRRYTITEGAEKGLDIIDCDNGKIRFLLNVSKALDIAQMWCEGKNISFLSKNGLTARETNFTSRFEGGMLYTCGLDSLGGREGYETHGSYHNTPAKITRAECTADGIFVEAEIVDTALFGKNLLLKRKISSVVNKAELHIEDELINRGYKEENYCILYHVNLGYPLLDDGAQMVVETEDYTPRTSWSKQNEGSRYEICLPIVGEEETCYFIKTKTPQASLVNKRLGKKFTITWSKDTLPCFLEWRSMAAGDYALGLEPCTTELDDNFTYKTILAGENVRFSICLKVENIQ